MRISERKLHSQRHRGRALYRRKRLNRIQRERAQDRAPLDQSVVTDAELLEQGQVWKLNKAGVDLMLLTMPSLLARRPGEFLLPSDVVAADGLAPP